MCGIAGFIGHRPISAHAREAMLAALRTRGPDGEHIHAWQRDTTGHWAPVSGAAPATDALLHTRLAIIDPRPEADQPFFSADGDIALVYNGEVYDWAEDATHLCAAGAIFRTRADTEFILHAYRHWGWEGMLARLRGMFAIGLIDRRLGKLFLARDRMGEKPLVYALRPDGVAFGSTVRSVLPWLPPEARDFDPAAIDAYLAHRYIPAPRTVFRDIARLENAHYLEIDLTRFTVRKVRYWQPMAHRTTTATEALAELGRAVTIRTVADRPLGVFLSGGIDSSCVASLLVASGHTALDTFTAAFPGSSMDESADAAHTAAVLGLKHHVLPVTLDWARDFERLVADLDEPFADPSSLPTWALARETVRHVTVVLGGDGGDEVLAGYKRHDKHLKTAWRHSLRLPIRGRPSPAPKGWPKWCDEFGMTWRDAYSLRFSGFTPAQRRFLQPDTDLPEHHWRVPDVEESNPLKQLLALDFANTLPEYILRKGDLCTMAHGLELRAPLLDHVWVEALLGVPDHERFTRPAKQLLAAAMPQLAPLDLFGRKKRGFNPPLAPLLAGPLANRLEGLAERLAAHSPSLDAPALRRLLSQPAPDEQRLQCLLLDESLAQLSTLRGK